MTRVKMIDIANKLGVSIAAVSFALNNKPGVSEDMRRKILSAADQMGYIRSKKNTYRSRDDKEHVLILNCSRTAITYDIFPQTPYFSELLRAFEERLNSEQYHFWIKSLCIDNNFSREIRALLSSPKVNGVLLVATDMEEHDVEVIQKIKPSVVILDSCYDRLVANCVVMDNYLGGVLAARHFIELGHTRIGYIQSRTRIYNFEMRKKGFIEELARNGLQLDPQNILESESSIEASSESLLKYTYLGTQKPTCYFAESDYMAIGLLRVLQHNGIHVPEQIAVIGFDNIDMAGIVTPALTTINVPKGKLAETCISQLLHMLNHEHVWGMKQFISVDLVKRETT